MKHAKKYHIDIFDYEGHDPTHTVSTLFSSVDTKGKWQRENLYCRISAKECYSNNFPYVTQ